MIKLAESGLFGEKLISIDSPILVERYNDCLREIGLRETALTRFHVDGWGWSPEIAEEQDNRFYLSQGYANHYGIIVSPAQRDCSIYMPLHSFDWDIHHQVFEHYYLQIEDLTTSAALWYELDQDISLYRRATDLLMMDVVNITFNSTRELIEAAREQKELVRRFDNESLSWSNRTLLEDLIESSKKHGDLRFRKLDLPPIPFANISSFFTEAFGGIYVFRKVESSRPFLIYANDSYLELKEEEKPKDELTSFFEFNVKDDGLMDFLLHHRLIGFQPEFYRDKLRLIDHQKDYILQKCISENIPEANSNDLNPHQLKGVLNQLVHKDLLDDKYFLLEEARVKLQNNAGKEQIPQDVIPDLYHPLPMVDRQEKIVLWQLLSEMQQNNPLITYLFNKALFYSQYQQMTEGNQLWAIKTILKDKSMFMDLIK